MMRLTFLLGAAAMLAGCNVDANSRYYPTEAELHFRDTFGPRFEVTVPRIYCYSTLADPDCYATPVPGWEPRLIAQYGPRAY